MRILIYKLQILIYFQFYYVEDIRDFALLFIVLNVNDK